MVAAATVRLRLRLRRDTQFRKTAPEARAKLVVGSGLGANLLVKFVDALYDAGRIFEQPVVIRDRQFMFNPMPLITESRPLTQRTYDQWQHWIETTVQQYEGMAA